MSDQTAPPVGQDLDAVESRVTKLEARVDKLEGPAPTTPAGTPEGAENVVNPGENLERTETNPAIDPHQPGVEPDAPVQSGSNAPPSTNPEGDTAKENAPETPAPEPDGANVATNPGTDSTSDAQTEVPQGTTSGEAPAGSAVDNGTPAPQPAAEASEKPLYTSGTGGIVPDSYKPSGLQTPDGKVLYHFDGDTAGEPHTGELPVYADDVVPAS